ncbi:MAG: tetratricopeptide repeat protein [Magnetococcales bacterium]|nr:tetratricopeptide repeat protein [Magnetococcales bacterium]
MLRETGNEIYPEIASTPEASDGPTPGDLPTPEPTLSALELVKIRFHEPEEAREHPQPPTPEPTTLDESYSWDMDWLDETDLTEQNGTQPAESDTPAEIRIEPTLSMFEFTPEEPLPEPEESAATATTAATPAPSDADARPVEAMALLPLALLAPTPSPTPTPAPTEQPDAPAAPVAAPPGRVPRKAMANANRKKWLRAASALLLGCGLASGYFVLEHFQGQSDLVSSKPAPRAPTSRSETNAPVRIAATPPAAAAPPVQAPAPVTTPNPARPADPPPQVASQAVPATPAAAPPPSSAEPTPAPAPTATAQPAPPAAHAVQPQLPPAPQVQQPPVRLPGKTAAKPPANPMHEGRKALQKGDLAAARRHFEQALTIEPHNHTAISSLASVAIRERKPEEARSLYQAILKENPHDTLAIAALASLNGNSDSFREASQIQHLLRQSPNEPHLHFVLGNILVAQKNWPEAQAAFFNAYRLDRTNPDILFNLAVTLDRMGQEKSALTHYRDALRLQEQYKSGGFDPQAIQRRIAILEQRTTAPALPPVKPPD